MPGQNLTRAEAEARAAVVTPHTYEVTLDLTTGEDTFRSRSTIRFAATRGAETFVDLIARSVESATLNGTAIDPALFSDSRLRIGNLEAENELVVDATCEYSRSGEGLHRFVDPADGEVYLYSQFEVADARRMFAVFEQPDLKATFAFDVRVPAHCVAVSNQREQSVTDDGDARVWSFPPTDVLSCYVTALVAGPYHVGEREATYTSTDGREIPMRVYCRTSLAPHLDVEELQDIAAAGMAFYEAAYERPYPYAKYDQLFVPEFNAGAMENAGCVTFTEKYVFRSKVPDALRERRVVTILHELAHMWFGDLVTMKWWNDLWLNESFAEFMSTLATAEATSWTDAWTTFNSLEKSWALSQDQLPSTHPIVAPINDLEDVEVNFDGITYAKGASVLRQLVAWVGQDEFLAGVAAYVAKHQWGNAVLADLLAELEVTSGRSLADWSAKWLETSGVNVLTPVIREDADGTIASFEIAQEPDASSGILRPHRLVVGGYSVMDGRLDRVVREELDVDGALTAVPALTGVARPDLILINDEDLAYAKIRLDERSLATATRHLDGFRDSLPRALVLSAAWDMTRDGEWSAHQFADLVLGAIAGIDDSTVVMVLLRQLATAVAHYSAPAGRAEFAADVDDRLWSLAAGAPSGSDLQLQLVKSAALHAVTDAQLDKVSGLLDGTDSLVGLAVDTDLAWELLTALAAGGRADGARVDAALAADKTATGEQAAAQARAAIPAEKEATWEAIIGGRLPNALQLATILGFVKAHDRSLLTPFVEPYFAAIERVWAERTPEMAEQVIAFAFPTHQAGLGTVDVLGEADTWLAAHPDAPAALRRLVVEGRDTARRAIAAQAVDAGA